MQLRHYLNILLRVWPLIVALPIAVGLLSFLVELRQPQRYGASARVMVTQTPRFEAQDPSLPDFNLFYSWQGSEYILDDLPQVVTSRMFAEDVVRVLGEQGLTVAPEVVQGSLQAQKFHRVITLASNTDNPELAVALIGAAVQALQSNGLKYWDRTNSDNAGLSIAILDPVGGAAPLLNRRQSIINVGLRTAFALAAAIGLAFLLHYLDDRLRDARQAEEWFGVEVLGIIPKE